MHILRYLLIALAISLMIGGGLLLLWCGQIVMQIINEPEQVGLLQFIAKQIPNDGPLVFGGTSESNFEINLSGSGKMVIFFVLGIFALGVLAGIVKSLISAGVDIMRAALAIPLPPERDDRPQATNRTGGSRISR